MKTRTNPSRRNMAAALLGGALMLGHVAAAVAQNQALPGASGVPPASVPVAEGTNVTADVVTINVDDAMLTQVLNAFSRQTGRSIVVGPEVTGKVTARLSDVQWRDALDVILKPCGYGYYLVGDTVVIGSTEKLPRNVVRIFTLKYLDVSDVEALVNSQLSPGVTIGRLITQSQSWKDAAIQADIKSTTSESLGRLQRFAEEPKNVKGKTFVVVDTPTVIERVAEILAQVDRMPTQIHIEAKFVEVRADLLRDIGFEWGSGVDGATAPGVKTVGITSGGKLYAAGGQQISGTVKPAAFKPQSGDDFSGVRPFNAGMTLAFQKLTDYQFQVLLHLLEEDSSYKVLSSPSVQTMNNQDAVIIVGTKLPIIKSETTANAGGSPTTSTSLERYEDVGIKLKVLPQVCEDGFINLIVHPSVRDLLSYQSGKTSSGGSLASLTDYPVVATREAETQVMVKSGQTIVIGGMVRESKQTTQFKVPFLGDIPLVGRLFRRDTDQTEQIELLIFLTARVRSPSETDGTVAPESVAEAPAAIRAAKAAAAAK